MARVRIVAGGVHHETNSFTPIPTAYGDFEIDRGGERYRDEAGALAPLDQIDLATTFVAGAQPGGLVRREAYERLRDALLAEVRAALPADGLLLDLHGAMEVEGVGDGETDLIRSVRALVGDDMPVAVSLDLHGNISPELVARADVLTAYRTAPHRDARETRRRALSLLAGAIARGVRPASAMVKLPLVLPGECAVTDVEPARSLYAALPGVSAGPGLLDASIMIGCAWTDSPFATVSAIAVAESDRAAALAAASRLAAGVWARRAEFALGAEALAPEAAVAAALAGGPRPTYISDSGDNVTAGAPGDSPALAALLAAAGARSALVAGIADAPAVAACAAAGAGASVRLRIGATLDPRGGPPLACEALVERVAEPAGRPRGAVVLAGGVRIILTEGRCAFTERADIAAYGADPEAHEVTVVKLGYLFPDLAAHAGRAILALSTGATTLRLDTLPYRLLPRPAFPLDPGAAWGT